MSDGTPGDGLENGNARFPLKRPCYAKELDIAEERLLNAFQLVKNGKQISYLKFEGFKKLMDKKHDHEGNLAA